MLTMVNVFMYINLNTICMHIMSVPVCVGVRTIVYCGLFGSIRVRLLVCRSALLHTAQHILGAATSPRGHGLIHRHRAPTQEGLINGVIHKNRAPTPEGLINGVIHKNRALKQGGQNGLIHGHRVPTQEGLINSLIHR